MPCYATQPNVSYSEIDNNYIYIITVGGIVKSLFLMFLFITTNAMAASIEFKFDINSSGPSIYPCDAGLMHEPHDERVCYDRVTSDSCNPNNCIDEVDCNCVCTGAGSNNGQGEYRLDFLNASYADWTENGDTASNVKSKNVAAKDNKFGRVFTGKEEWEKQLTKLSFNLGSERYGAEFYLDICYRGPQIEYHMAGSINDTPNFFLKSQATVTDINTNNGLNYSSLADLQVKAVAICDQQGVGTYVYAHDNSNNYDDPLAHQIENSMANFGQYYKATNYSGFNTGSNLFLIKEYINKLNTKTPRFCKIRYSFKENKRNTGDLLSQIRKWKIQQAEVCTYTSINEDL